MKQRVVIIGQSPLSYFLARSFDQELGNLVQTDLLWLVADAGVAHLPTTESLLDTRVHKLPTPRFTDLKTRKTLVKSINLPERRLVTASGVIDFDELVIDQTPTYSASELIAIRHQIITLLDSLQARFKLGKPKVSARINCQGDLPEAWQLALLIHRDIIRHYPGLITVVKVLADLPGNHIGDFLRRNGLTKATATNLELPGITIKPPVSLINNRQVKGLKLGRDGRALVTAALSPQGFPNVTVFDSSQIERINVLRFFRSLARSFTQELAKKLDGHDRAKLEVASPAFVLRGHLGSYLLLGELENRRVRANFVAQLDTRLRRSL